MTSRRRFGRVLMAASLLAIALVGFNAITAMAMSLTNDIAFTFGPPPQSNTFINSSGYWSVVGIQPFNGANYNVDVFDPTGVKRESSAGTGVDFVAVNANFGHAPVGTWTANVSAISGSQNFSMEYSDDRTILSSNAQNQVVNMGLQGGFVTSRDIFLNGGSRYNFTWLFANGSSWGAGYIMPSSRNWGSPSDSVFSCGPVVAACGVDSWQAPTSGWYAVIVVDVGRPFGSYPSFDASPA